MTMALANHLFVNRFRYGEETANIRTNHFVPGTVRRRSKIVTAVDGRIVDKNIYAPPFVYQLPRQMLHPETIGD